DILAKQKPGAGNEIQLTDAIDDLNKTQRVFAHEFTGKRYDVGDKLGMVEANIEYGLKHPEIREGLRNYLRELSKKL
ncbi:MAG: UTP--glucose-1-phosphate uridylyltransferase, partial [Enterococcus viikkiensis]